MKKSIITYLDKDWKDYFYRNKDSVSMPSVYRQKYKCTEYEKIRVKITIKEIKK